MNIYVLSDAKEFSVDGTNFVTLDSPKITRSANSVTIDPRDGSAPVNVFPATEIVTIDGSTTANPYTPFALVRALKTAFLKGNSALPSSSGISSKTTAQRDAIVNPDAGTIIYNSTTGFNEQFEDSYWQWMPFGSQQGAIAKYYFDYTRPFYTANNDHIFTFIPVNSGSANGGGAPAGSTAESGSTGTLSTGALANGRIGIATSSTIIFGSGQTMTESRIFLPVLSNSTDRYIVFAGFSDNTTGVDVGNGMGIFYDEGGITVGSTPSPNWQLVTAVNNVRTIGGGMVTNVVASAGTWIKLRTHVAIDGSWVRYYINDVLVNPGGADVTTNIATGATRISRVNTFIHKNSGTNPRTMLLTETRFRQKYTNPR